MTPDQLASESAELSYETLSDAVADPVDGGLWSEELEIDESRVSEMTLRQNHKTASRVLAGLARSKTQSSLIPESVLNELVGTYCLHLTTRFDIERGEQHIRDTYGERKSSQFWRHPDPDRMSSLSRTPTTRALSMLALAPVAIAVVTTTDQLGRSNSLRMLRHR
ncbi:hypothetical protein DMJ13_25660 [halophilic archaeon]|nr:hypothetical protein DMJ13_25660 [halophilic archaeon]